MSPLRRLLALTSAFLLITATAACGSGDPPSPPPSTSDPDASPTATGSGDPDPGDCAAAASGELWRTHLTGPLSAAAQAAAYVLVGSGSTLRSLDACDGEPAGSLSLDGPVVGAPIVAGDSDAAFVTTTTGSVYGVTIDPETGALAKAWSRSLVRATCPQGDRISAPPAYADNVVYVGTEHGCGGGLDNWVVALKAGTGAVLWTFNEFATSAVGAVRAAPVPDAAGNRLYVGTYLGAGSGPTLYALNLAAGTRLWSADAGSVVVAPLLLGERVVTADQQGNVRAWPTGSQHTPLWTVPVGAPVELGLVDLGSVDVVDSVLLVTAGGSLTPVNHGGFANPKLVLPTGQVSTAPAPYAAEGVFYVGGTDGRLWQLDVFGTVALHRDVAPGAAVSAATLGFDDPSIVVSTSSGDVVKLAVPWPNE